MGEIRYIDEEKIEGKRVLLRVDFNVSLHPDHSIANDERIRQAVPTIEYLIKNHNRVIIISHLGRPIKREKKHSLRQVSERLQSYLPKYKVRFIDEKIEKLTDMLSKQYEQEVILLENIRFYPQEQRGDAAFARLLSRYADVYVNDAFGVSHRPDASIVAITQMLPSYGGLLMKKEVETIGKAVKDPTHPFVAIIGGSKISTKLSLLSKLTEVADQLIVGGGLANTFLAAQGFNVGRSICEYGELDDARRLFYTAVEKNTSIKLPTDVVVARSIKDTKGTVKDIEEVNSNELILDIGPETQRRYEQIILGAKTIIWNGPVGYFENKAFKHGTDAIYSAIVHNERSVSIVGGGDTIAALSHKRHLEIITHISTGGGAMLEYIEKGTLPGIDALKISS